MKLKYWIVGSKEHGYRIYKRTWYGTKKYVRFKEAFERNSFWGDNFIIGNAYRSEIIDVIDDMVTRERNKQKDKAFSKKFHKEEKQREKQLNKYWKSVL